MASDDLCPVVTIGAPYSHETSIIARTSTTTLYRLWAEQFAHLVKLSARCPERSNPSICCHPGQAYRNTTAASVLMDRGCSLFWWCASTQNLHTYDGLLCLSVRRGLFIRSSNSPLRRLH